jgi:cysteine sulfinate desulfinase/cysteine desulfurase-like protein
MGVPDAAAREAIRVSLGWGSEPHDIERLVEHWAMIYRRARPGAYPRPVSSNRELSG